MEFRNLHTVDTGENVGIHLELAGLASRVFAFAIDSLFMLTLSALLMIAMTLGFLNRAPQLTKTVLPLGTFLIFFGYHLLQEWLWNGKTLGKSFLNIRVVRDNGQPVGFWESLGRNLLRVVDVYASGIGLLCMMIHPGEKRLGDMLSGTLVISEKSFERAMPDGLDGDARLAALSPEEADWLVQYRARRRMLLPEAREKLSKAACTYLEERLHTPLSTESDLDRL